MDVHRRELYADAPRTGWLYWLDVAAALLPFWWIPALAIAVLVLVLVLGIRAIP